MSNVWTLICHLCMLHAIGDPVATFAIRESMPWQLTSS